MLVAIKKYEFYIIKTKFYKFIIKLGITLKFYPIYKLTEIENLALQEFVKKNLRKGYI